MIPPLRARTRDPSTEQSSKSNRPARRSSASSAGPYTCLGQIPQPAPGRHPGAAHRLRRNITPRDTGPQHVQNVRECYSVGNTQPPGVASPPFGSGRSSGATRSHGSSGTRSARIPDTLPTKIAEHKTRAQLILKRSVSRPSPRRDRGRPDPLCRRPRPQGLRRLLAHHPCLGQEVRQHQTLGEERPAQPRRLPLGLRFTTGLRRSQTPTTGADANKATGTPPPNATSSTA